MNDQRRFSAAPVNFDRFVSLNRSHSRSLSPDRELHQMLRPYQSRLTANGAAPASPSASGGPPTHVGTSVHGGQPTRASPKPPPLSHSLEKANRRSTDMLGHAATIVLEGQLTQAATPPSRSVSGAAATATPLSAHSSMELASSGEVHAPATAAAPRYFTVEDEPVEVGRSQGFVEEVDVLLHAVQQLGSPLYNPVTDEYLCWNLHALERRPRSSYGDIEGVCCDFCGHTDWLDSLVEAEGEGEKVPKAQGKATTKSKGRKGKQDSGMKAAQVKVEEDAVEDGVVASGLQKAVPVQRRYLYHCPVCEVDICQACLDEVRVEERLHVPCLQCQRCGAYETRQHAPVHQCRRSATSRPSAEVKQEEEKEVVMLVKEKMNQVLESCLLPSNPTKSMNTTTVPAAARAAPIGFESSSPVKKYAGAAAVRSHVRLGLSRRSGGGGLAATAEAALRVPVPAVKSECTADEEEEEENAILNLPSRRAAPSDALPVQRVVATSSDADTPATSRKRGYTKRVESAPTNAVVRTRVEEERRPSEESDDTLVTSPPPPPPQPLVQSPQRKRQQGALPSPNARGRRAESYGATAVIMETGRQEQQQQELHTALLSTARYEVHLSPESSEEVEEVRRVARELHLLLIPPPSARTVSVAYFPTRLAAESCVDRATAGALQVVLKRYTRSS